MRGKKFERPKKNTVKSLQAGLQRNSLKKLVDLSVWLWTCGDDQWLFILSDHKSNPLIVKCA